MPPRSRRPRVFIGLTEVAGYYRNLEVGFREIGVDAKFFEFSANPLRYGSEVRPGTTGASTELPRLHPKRVLRGLWTRATRGPTRFARAMAFFLWGLVRYDAFIFYGLDSFLWYRDLPILKAFGKTVIYVFNGSDHRPPYLNGKFVREVGQHQRGWLHDETLRVKRRIERVERHADAIVALSASAQFHTRPFLHFLAIGLPNRPPRSLGSVENKPDRVQVLHCPTNREAKGSDEIRSLVEGLISSGRPVDYVELTGVPNSEVLAAIGESSFVVDEMYSDTPMAGFAAEAAWQGKAAIVSGLYANEVDHDLPLELIPPTLFVRPEEIGRAIERALDPELRDDVGRKARAYVEERWRPADVANRFIAIIDGLTPSEWWYQPERLRYFGGWGMTESMVRDGIRTILAEGGTSALHLDHHPALRQAVVEFAQ